MIKMLLPLVLVAASKIAFAGIYDPGKMVKIETIDPDEDMRGGELYYTNAMTIKNLLDDRDLRLDKSLDTLLGRWAEILAEQDSNGETSIYNLSVSDSNIYHLLLRSDIRQFKVSSSLFRTKVGFFYHEKDPQLDINLLTAHVTNRATPRITEVK